MLEALGDVCERFGAYDRSFDALEAARELVGAGVAARSTRASSASRALVHELLGPLRGGARGLRARVLPGSSDADEGPERDAVRATIELNAGAIHYRQTNNEEAIRWLEAAAEHAERAGDRGTLAHAYYLLDAAHSDFGAPDGLRYLELARPIYEELGDLRGLGVVLSNLGIHAYYEGRWDESLAFYRESRDVKERAGDVIGAVIQVNNEAEILSDQGLIDEAMPLFEEMLRVSRASGWAFGAGAALSNLGRADARAGRFEEAHALFDDALAVFEELSAERFKVEAKARRAECLVFEGRHQEALEVGNGVPRGGGEVARGRGRGADRAVDRLRPPPGAAAGRGAAALRGEPAHRAGAEGGVRGGADAARDGGDGVSGGRRPRRPRATRSSSGSASSRCRPCRCPSYATGCFFEALLRARGRRGRR